MRTQLAIIAALYVATGAATFVLDYLNLRHSKRHGNDIPPEFEGAVNADRLELSTAYTMAKSRFAIFSGAYNQVIVLVFIFGGVLEFYNNRLSDYSTHYSWSFPLWGVIFVMLLSYGKTALNLPFNLYRSFGIEKRFGFNTMTFGLWLTDLLKALLVSTVLASALLLAVFWLIGREALSDIWWLPVWGCFFAFTLFVVYITPYVLEPLFNKFTPIKDRELASAVKEMLAKAGIKVRGVYRMDASKRTRHSNAYFTGLGRVKRIVIFDTLMEKLSRDELLAVLAHEAAHCKHRHVLKNLVIFEALAAVGVYVAFLILRSSYLTELFALSRDTFFAKMILLSFLASIVLWGMPWFFNMISRHFERQADDFAMDIIGDGKPLASALVKLSADNLSNIHPQKFYAMYNYAHPTELERVRALNAGRKQAGGGMVS